MPVPVTLSDPTTPPPSSLPAPQAAKLWKAARDFEAMAVGELLRPMFDTIDAAHGPFGGGEAEAAWRPMQIEAIGKQMAARGGLGFAVPVFAALVRTQEAHQGGST